VPTEGDEGGQEGHHRHRGHHRAKQAEGASQYLTAKQPAGDWRSIQEATGWRLGTEGNRGQGIGADVQGKDL